MKVLNCYSKDIKLHIIKSILFIQQYFPLKHQAQEELIPKHIQIISEANNVNAMSLRGEYN